jgi:hypothetical protein
MNNPTEDAQAHRIALPKTVEEALEHVLAERN